MEYRYTYATGRNRTDTERTGTRFHAVPVDNAYPASFTKALCGFAPGRRSNGWSDYVADEVTCPRCAKKMERVIQAEEMGAMGSLEDAPPEHRRY